MDLDLDSSMQNTSEQTNEFLQELKDSLEQRKSEQITYLDKVLKENNVLEKYKEQIYENRNSILKDYAKDTAEKGCLYYIHGMHNNNDSIIYDVVVCNSNGSNKMTFYSSNLPSEARIRKCI